MRCLVVDVTDESDERDVANTFVRRECAFPKKYRQDYSLSSEIIHNMHNSFLQGIYRRVSISQLSSIANEHFSSRADVVFLTVLKFCVLDRPCKVSVRGLFII